MENKKRNWKKILLVIGCVLLALILTLLLAAAAVWNYLLGKVDRPDLSEPTLSQEEIDAILNETDPLEELPTEETVTTTEATVPATVETQPEETSAPTQAPTVPAQDASLITKSEHVINILLIGQDRRPGEGRQRSDAMILCTVNKKEKTLTMTSFLRDTYVNLPDWNGKSFSPNRLNVNYALGGMGMLDLCLKETFGIVVDHNIEVDFTGFTKIIDTLGGVGIYLTLGEANHLAPQHPGLKQGVNLLDGEAALAYSRIRKIDGDYSRTNRQKTVLKAIFERCKTMDAAKLAKLVDTVLPMIKTDMTDGDITRYLLELAPLLPQLELRTQTIPEKGTYTHQSIRGMSVVVTDFQVCRDILEDTIGG